MFLSDFPYYLALIIMFYSRFIIECCFGILSLLIQHLIEFAMESLHTIALTQIAYFYPLLVGNHLFQPLPTQNHSFLHIEMPALTKKINACKLFPLYYLIDVLISKFLLYQFALIQSSLQFILASQADKSMFVAFQNREHTHRIYYLPF